MDKNEVKAQVRKMLDAGTAKSDVFARLAGRGVKDSQLAYFIASYADPKRCYLHDRKVNILITIMFVQALIGFLSGVGIGARMGPDVKWIVGALVASIPLLLAWGFYKHRVGAYNAYMLLAILQLPQSFGGFESSPMATLIALAVNVAVLAFVWHVRERIFPDFTFIAPKKIRGEYVFSG